MSPQGKIRIEKRENPRFEVKLPASLVKVGEAEKDDKETLAASPQGEVQDLSKGGVRIFCDSPFAVGDLVAMNIAIPDEVQGVRGTAEVVWFREALDLQVQGSYKYAMGLRFVEVRAESQSFIARFVEQNLKQA